MRDNLQTTGFSSKATVLKHDVQAALEMLNKQGHVFSLVFCDPPYMTGLAEAALQKVNRLKMLIPGAIVVAEHSRREVLAEQIGGFSLIRREQYGDTTMSFYSYQEEEQP
jgi:16S rRNA G966 N2-methylase RsmD